MERREYPQVRGECVYSKQRAINSDKNVTENRRS
jgi:hypothetical protein